MLAQILDVTVPVFGVALLGFVYGRFAHRDMAHANHLNMVLFVPALVFYVLSEKIPSVTGIVDMAIGAAIVVLGSGLLALPFARLLKVPDRALLPTVMFNNCGNLGLPLASLAFGEASLPLAVIAFVVSVGLNFSFGTWYLGDRLNPLVLLRDPIFLATAAGIGCNLLGLHAPRMLLPGLEMLAGVSVPLMLVALGVRLVNMDLRHWRVGLLGAVLAPATGIVSAALAIWLLGLDTAAAKSLLLFGALPPAVFNYLMAEKYHQHPDLVVSMVAIDNVFALISIPLVLAFLL